MASEQQEKEKKTNNDRKIEALLVRAQRAHDWRVIVWAQSEQRLRTINAQLEVLGAEPFEPFEPLFDDDDMLDHYSNMKLKK